MALALRLNDLISFDRNRGLAPQKMIPRGRLISKAECLRLCPALDSRELTGGMLFFDGQVYNSERLILSLLLSATRAGADLVNYVQAIGFLRERNTIFGLRAADVLSGNLYDVQARVVVNCSGPWVDDVLRFLGISGQPRTTPLLKAAVLVTRPLVREVAVGISCNSPYKDGNAIIDKGHRYFFITPWRNTSLVGTLQAPYDGNPDNSQLTEQNIDDFIREVNAALPGAGLARDDVYFTYSGLVPRADATSKAEGVQLAKHYQIRDHAAEGGIDGLVTVVGVKYTTARDVAEKTVDVVERKIGKSPTVCQTAITPLQERAIGCFEESLTQGLGKRPAGVSTATLHHLLQTYGSEYWEILRYGEADPEWHQPIIESSPVIKAQVLHGIREEMAQKLSDVIFRRTELGTAGHPGALCLKSCAGIMARELGWEQKRMLKEIEEVETAFCRGRS